MNVSKINKKRLFGAENFRLTKKIRFLPFLILSLILISCHTLPREEIQLSRKLLDEGKLSAAQLADFFSINNPRVNYDEILQFARYYIKEASDENINSDVAFAQMCLETGFLKFGGLVTKEMHNYCGLGSMDAEHPGEVFETEELGVRAHIQHLQAYATTEDVPLNNELIDPRYNWVHKTKLAYTIEDLAGSWAMDPSYGAKIDAILMRMEDFINE
ncbi:MAG: glucosaminidase domain-containing protein [Treponema sp.]|nr:glucosaminidase domain-containing protein [Treponema sp.]